jgi:hypothetical protein
VAQADLALRRILVSSRAWTEEQDLADKAEPH